MSNEVVLRAVFDARQAEADAKQMARNIGASLAEVKQAQAQANRELLQTVRDRDRSMRESWSAVLAGYTIGKDVIKGVGKVLEGTIDAALVGGVDSLCLTTLYGFASLELTSSDPCRPCDAGRNCISIG